MNKIQHNKEVTKVVMEESFTVTLTRKQMHFMTIVSGICSDEDHAFDEETWRYIDRTFNFARACEIDINKKMTLEDIVKKFHQYYETK